MLSEMIPWCDRAGDEDLPLGVEVWVEKSRGMVSSLVPIPSNEGDPFVKCYKLSFAGEGIGNSSSYPLTLEQGDYLRRLGVEVCH